MKNKKKEAGRFPFPAPTYVPTPERCSIIGDGELNFQVRNGAGCDLSSIGTKKRGEKIEGISSIPFS